MEPSDEELGAFNLSECQSPGENRRQWVLQEEVGRVQDRIPLLANGGWRWVDTVSQIKFWYGFHP